MVYNIEMVWVAGKVHLVADALSQQPLFGTMTNEEDATHGTNRLRRTFTDSHKYAHKDPKCVVGTYYYVLLLCSRLL